MMMIFAGVERKGNEKEEEEREEEEEDTSKIVSTNTIPSKQDDTSKTKLKERPVLGNVKRNKINSHLCLPLPFLFPTSLLIISSINGVICAIRTHP